MNVWNPSWSPSVCVCVCVCVQLSPPNVEVADLLSWARRGSLVRQCCSVRNVHHQSLISSWIVWRVVWVSWCLRFVLVFVLWVFEAAVCPSWRARMCVLNISRVCSSHCLAVSYAHSYSHLIRSQTHPCWRDLKLLILGVSNTWTPLQWVNTHLHTTYCLFHV